RIARDKALQETGVLLSRVPPIYRKISHRRKLVAELESWQAKVQAEPLEKDGRLGAERRKLMASMEVASTAVNGITQEIITSIEQLETERGTMLVPQISMLVGCQAFFFRKSSEVLE
ncbi:unnamed protein product, partial [Choristocarpus tenellus]